MSAKVVKGHALTDILDEHPLQEDSPLNDELSDEPHYLVDCASRLNTKDCWGMNSDDASRTNEHSEIGCQNNVLQPRENVHSILLSSD